MTDSANLVVDGLTLPIHDTDDVLWHEAQYIAAVSDGLDSFIRIARPFGYRPDISLGKRLLHVDSALHTIAKYCGISVVPYQWGVCRDAPDMFKDYPRDDAKGLLPAGFLLVAEVTSIIPVEHSLESFDAVFKRMQNTTQIDSLIAELDDGIQTPYTDYDIEQVMYGRLATNPEGTPQWYYVDPDPLLNAEDY